METIFLDDFLCEGLIREKDFRSKIESIDWSKYEEKKVMIKGRHGCGLGQKVAD